MATTVDELIVQIRADTADLRKGLNGVKQQLGTLDKSTNRSIATFQNLGRVFAVLGLAQVGRSIVNTSRTFEDLNATLRAITGSSEAAAKSMELITAFTANTTFQLENVTSAFTTLLNAGITPTSDVLTDFGNVAAAFGKDITQISQAAFNATTGEMEMLKQFGIIAKVEGDKLAVTFDNTTTLIERDSQSIIDFIRKIGSEKFPTALEERANTVSGAFSNLADATSILFNEVGESGLNEALVRLARNLIDVVNNLRPIASGLGKAINLAFQQLGRLVEIVAENMKKLVGAIIVYMSIQIAAATVRTGIAFVKFAQSITVARAAMVGLNIATRRSPLILLGLAAVAAGADFEMFANIFDRAFAQMEAAFPGLTAALQDMMMSTEEITTNISDLDEEMKELLGDTSAAIKELPELTSTVEDEIEAMNESIIASTQQMTGTFVQSLMEGENAMESFKNFAKNIVSQVISTFMNLYVVNGILNAIFGGLGLKPLPTKQINLGGGGMRAPPPTVPNSAVINFDPNAMVLRNPLGQAGGGSVSRGQPYLVGERGPELFMPNTGGRIMNNADTSGVMSGSGPVVVNQTINLSAGVVGTVRSEVQRMLPEIANVTKLGVLEASRRGGAYRKGLLGT